MFRLFFLFSLSFLFFTSCKKDDASSQNIEEEAEGVVRLVLDNPGMRNAMSDEMTASWVAAIDALAVDESVRVVVVTGEGTAFCSGGNTSWIAGEPDASVDRLRTRMMAFYRAWLSIRRLEVPTIAAINGPAIGAAQWPGGAGARAVRDRSDDDVVVGGRLEQHVQADVERLRERDDDVQAQAALAGLESADGRGAQVRPRSQLVEGVAERGAQAAQSGACQLLDVDGAGGRSVAGHGTSMTGLAIPASPFAGTGQTPTVEA